ncbi:hypothetical protein MPER_01613 [Moniliophthora perniciosa FA553]|nr:hypothetical protein MPER_01613 [Moniliophthora perniciosa FA553]
MVSSSYIEARDSGAAGVLVISDGNNPVNPTASSDELEEAGDVSDVVIVVLPQEAGQMVEELFSAAHDRGMGQLMLTLEREHQSATTDTGDTRERSEQKGNARILYLNGHPLQNTRLLV